MAGSLKAYAPFLARRLGTTPAALYERQRALVRDGILGHVEGRGPGSGVQVGPYQVALLLVAVLATDSLSETGDKVRVLATAKSIAKGAICPLTGESTFVEAVARVLDMTRDYWRNTVSIAVRRTTGSGSITYSDKLRSGVSVFAAQIPRDAQMPAPTSLKVDATLTRDLIIAIASDLEKIAGSEQRNRSAALQRTEESEERIRRHGQRTGRANARRLREGKKP